MSSRCGEGGAPVPVRWPGKRTLAQSLPPRRRPSPKADAVDAKGPEQEPIDIDQVPDPIGQDAPEPIDIDKIPDPPAPADGKDTKDAKNEKPEPIDSDKVPDPIDIAKLPEDPQPEGPQFSPDLPVPRPAPGPKPAAGQGPGSGIDWSQIWQDNKLNVLRTWLEVQRLVPGLGLFAGAAADIVEGQQNLASLDKVKGTPAGDKFRAAMITREVVVGMNNVIGHVRYVLEAAQDATVASLIGAKVAAITVPLNEALTGISLGVKLGQTMLDAGIAVAADMEAAKNVDNPEAYKAYHGLMQTFVVNTATDGISVFLDIADLATGGFANAAVIKEAKGAITATTRTVFGFKQSLLPVINSWLSIWGATEWGYRENGLPRKDPAASQGAANVVEADGPVSLGDQVGPQGMRRAVAGAIMLKEIDQIEQAYRVGAFFVENAAATPQRMATQVSQAITQITGKKDPFVWLRDRLSKGIKEQTEQVTRLMQIQSMAGTAQSAATAASSAMDTVIGALDKVTMPDIPEPAATDLGDSAVADSAEKLIDGARGLGAAAVRRVRNRLQGAIDASKAPARQMASDVKADMDWTVEFLGKLQTMANQQIGEIGQLGTDFAAKLGQCQNVDDIFNMFFGLGAKIMGAEEFSVEDLRRNWQEIRGAIDRGFVVAREVATGVGGGPPSPGAKGPESGGPDPASATAGSPAPDRSPPP